MTNQASEDELKAIIEWYVDRTAVLAKQDGTSFNNKHLLKLDMGTAIESLIRTEKLKLLAEVRSEQVDAMKSNLHDMVVMKRENYTPAAKHYALKRMQEINEELTKMEAEL